MSSCSMPDHGNLDANAACCRPGDPTYMGDPDTSSSALTFWRDPKVWKSAGANTLNCLVGCSIGDFGMMFSLNVFYPGLPVALTMALAMTAGLITSIGLETLILRLRQAFTWKNALSTAFSMSIISMLAMEFAATTTDYALTGGEVAPGSAWFWIALAISLAVGFVAPLPYNYFKLKKYGKACH